jgi:uncharacterized protein YndB with AHSA1/START domain
MPNDSRPASAASRSVVVERVIAQPPEKIWRALTQGPLIEAWLMKNDFQPVVGRKFNLRSEPMPHWNGVVDCEVLVLEPRNGCPIAGTPRACRRWSPGR